MAPLKKKEGKPCFEVVCPMSLTPIFFKIYEGFLPDWLKEKIPPLTDQRKFGNLEIHFYCPLPCLLFFALLPSFFSFCAF